jgi:hypothetical protein
MDWYYQNGHDEFALSIPSYIVGYSLFNYSMPAPMRDLFNLYYQIMQEKYFTSLGIKGEYLVKKKILNSKVKKEIKSIISSHNDQYSELEVDVRKLEFQDSSQFAKSFLELVQGMNFERKDHR